MGSNLDSHPGEPGLDLKSVTLRPDEILKKMREEKKKFLKVCKGKTPECQETTDPPPSTCPVLQRAKQLKAEYKPQTQPFSLILQENLMVPRKTIWISMENQSSYLGVRRRLENKY